ncbi:MAG: lysylphosphatidylglycerol synthase transmembrane domain-containing protein [Lamprobacter sp.]|uniref:lysylphosphatidylglycerol synthase transmembrane domain-containing protein n=1 Tax=Lamprobacter sp. TaxID=3100796 RepID=UPI002B25CC05|nr:lysylphosphatidylglycerol synthase transmembrane domain-containing protein [Lamprobacter sp.]MEA3641258.1 lysylphosphatidylglycerol synthase transmembrane domain-containing protein [Lamprobacter sp.]
MVSLSPLFPSWLPRLGRPRDWLVGLALLTLVVVLVEATLGWSSVLAPWARLPPSVLVGAFLLTATSYLLRAVRVLVYFQTELCGRFPEVLRLSVLHNSANNLLPMRAGEMVFPWLMHRYFGHDFLAAGASLVWIRLLDLHFLGLIGGLALWVRAPNPGWLVLLFVWLSLLSLFWLIARLEFQSREGITGRFLRFLEALSRAAPQSQRRVLWLYFWTALSWSLKFIGFALILGHFVPAALWQLVLGVMGAELSSVLPFHGIAGSGSFELATVAAMVPLGVAPAEALAGAVNLHLFLLGATLMLGAMALLIPVQRKDR